MNQVEENSSRKLELEARERESQNRQNKNTFKNLRKESQTNRKRLRDTENKLVVARDGNWGGGEMEEGGLSSKKIK